MRVGGEVSNKYSILTGYNINNANKMIILLHVAIKNKSDIN